MLRRVAFEAASRGSAGAAIRRRRLPPFGNMMYRNVATSSPCSLVNSSSTTKLITNNNSNQHRQHRYMSDNLLGHSPMARPDPRPKSSLSPGASGPSIGVDSNTAGGGVWSQTSAKRDKIAELKVELPADKVALDDMATPAQKLDLDLADGLSLVARAVDGAWSAQSDDEAGDDNSRSSKAAMTHALTELEEFLNQTQESRGEDATLSRERYEAHFAEALRILEPDAAAASPSEKLTPRNALAQLRDFTEFDPESSSDDDDDNATDDSATAKSAGTSDSIPAEVDSDLRKAEDPFDECTTYLRLLTARHAAAHLKESWDDLTKLTDGDVDRAAVRGEVAEPASTLSLERVNDVLRAYASGTCKDRIDALWRLVDKDDDGLIDEVEMEYLAHWSMKPVESALGQLFPEALEELPSAEDAVAAAAGSGGDAASVGTATSEPTKKKGWRQRRKQAKAKKRIINIFNKTITNHFDVEVETPHRLRCIYAWADKAHQDNRIDSVHIESGTIAGRKRYVELAPKISLKEFRAEQEEHFAHLDRTGEEIVSSFREDLLVDQGKGRQNRELKRDIVVFLGVVSAIDAVIWTL